MNKDKYALILTLLIALISVILLIIISYAILSSIFSPNHSNIYGLYIPRPIPPKIT